MTELNSVLTLAYDQPLAFYLGYPGSLSFTGKNAYTICLLSFVVVFLVQAMVSWQSPLTRRHSRNSQNQGSELSNAAIVQHSDVVADITHSEDELNPSLFHRTTVGGGGEDVLTG